MNAATGEADIAAVVEAAVTAAMEKRPHALVYGGGASLNVHLHLSDDSAVIALLCEVIEEGRVGFVADRVDVRDARVQVNEATIRAEHVRWPLHAQREVES